MNGREGETVLLPPEGLAACVCFKGSGLQTNALPVQVLLALSSKALARFQTEGFSLETPSRLPINRAGLLLGLEGAKEAVGSGLCPVQNPNWPLDLLEIFMEWGVAASTAWLFTELQEPNFTGSFQVTSLNRASLRPRQTTLVRLRLDNLFSWVYATV